MSIPYDLFAETFLSKISEFELMKLNEEDRTATVDGYMKRALSDFRKNCKYDFFTTGDNSTRTFMVDVPAEDIDELADIVSEGMVVQWLKPYAYNQELLQNVLNTRDFSTYSPAELLLRVRDAYNRAQKDYTQKIREYSFNHGNLSDLHL